MKYFYCLIFILVGVSVQAEENPPINYNDKFPVLVDKKYAEISNLEKKSHHSEYEYRDKAIFEGEKKQERLEIDYIKYEKIKEFIIKFKQQLCSVNKNGAYEIWLQTEIGAGGVFVNATAQTGIKAIINCKDSSLKE